LKYRLIAIDIDGTLVNYDGTILPGSKQAVQRALDQGVQVTLATGRMYPPSARLAAELGLSTPLICYQGGLIREPDGGLVLWHKPISLAVAREVIRQIQQVDVELYVYVDDSIYVEKITEVGERYARHNQVTLNQVADVAAALRQPPTGVAVIGPPELIARLTCSLEDSFGPSLLVTRSYPGFCEIGHPEAGKGNALQYLTELLGIDQAETVAIGNGPNDISMLRWAGLGIVIGAAPAEVITAAAWVFDGDSGNNFTRALDQVLDT